MRRPYILFGNTVYIEIASVVLAEGLNQEHTTGKNEADQRYYLADAELTPVKAVCPQALNYGSAETVPSDIS